MAARMITQRDVANHAGVSMMTVSNVINGKSVVAEETRRRVEQAISELGYRPHPSAQHLARGRTGMITLAIPEVSIPYFAELAGFVMTVAARTHQNVLIEQTLWERDRELEILSDHHPSLTDALILYPSTLNADDVASIGAQVPVVLFGGSEALGHVDHVVIDNVRAGHEATQHLIDQGRLRIALIGPRLEPHSDKPNSRVIGYQQALRAAGLPLEQALLADAPAYHRRDGLTAMTRLLDLPTPPDAVFCLSDLLAIGALKAIRARGLRVPDDIALVGFDDIEDADYTEPPLTSVRPDKQEVARHAVALANSRLSGADGDGAPRIVVAGHELIVRASSTGLGEAPLPT